MITVLLSWHGGGHPLGAQTPGPLGACQIVGIPSITTTTTTVTPTDHAAGPTPAQLNQWCCNARRLFSTSITLQMSYIAEQAYAAALRDANER